MTPAEGLVLVVATALAATVVARGRKGTLDPTAGALLLILAMLATAAALAHWSAPRFDRTPGAN